MSFRSAARAALVGPGGPRRMLAAEVLILAMALFSLSCNSSQTSTVPNHTAYVTLPQYGSVLLLNIDGAHGYITLGPQTPPVEGTTPTGLALLPSKKFLYVANSFGNSVSTFNVNGDGSLTLTGTSTPAGSGPNTAVIDPSGQFLLVTNSVSNNISVFSIDTTSGALSPVGGSPFFANAAPTQMIFTHSGAFVYVTNPGLGTVTGFSFASGVLTQVPGSPFPSGAGASALTVDASDSFLYVANTSAVNPLLATDGNISGFGIDSSTGALTPLLGSPFTSPEGSGPSSITVDPTGQFVYAVTPQSSSSIWCFTINRTIGPTNGQLVPVANSPFSVASGGQFAIFDPLGNFFFIGSASGHAIEAYTYNSTSGVPTLVRGSPFSTGVPPGRMVLSE